MFCLKSLNALKNRKYSEKLDLSSVIAQLMLYFSRSFPKDQDDFYTTLSILLADFFIRNASQSTKYNFEFCYINYC